MPRRKPATTSGAVRVTLANGSTFVGSRDSVETILRLALYRADARVTAGPRGPGDSPPRPIPRRSA
jgi:hypothetical protein